MNSWSPTPPLIALLCAVSLLLAVPPARASELEVSREHAVLLARDGHHGEAVERLQALLERHPLDVRVRMDLMVVLEWAGRYQESAWIAAGLEPVQIEDYALLAWARALRGLGRVTDAMELLAPSLDDPERSADVSALYTLLRFDLIADLQQAGHLSAAATAYEALLEDDIETPAYVRHAAADAYLGLRQPRRAAGLYLAVLREEPSNFHARLGWIYSQAESEGYPEAIRAADEMAAALPIFVDGKPDPHWLHANLAAAMLQAYANNLAEAQLRLESMATIAPASADVRRELAMIYRWRGWPERSLAEIERARGLDPEAVSVRLSHVVTLRELGHFAEVESTLSALHAEHPANAQVRRERAAWAERQRWQVAIDSAYGDSDGVANLGSYDRHVQTRVTAPVLGYHWQPYALHAYSDGRFPEGQAEYRRLAAGLSWRHRRSHAYFELGGNTSGETETGVTAGYDWHRGDHWSFATRYESFSMDAPLRARNQGLTAWKVEGAARWQAHESLSMRAGLARLDLSDGNVRWSTLLSLQHRLLADARHVTGGQAELYASRHSQEGGPYFNPSQDASLAYGITHDWLTWRRYETALTQRFVVGAGAYWQEGFGADPIGWLRYEHEWRLSRDWRLVYGAGLVSRMYDGDREQRLDGRLSLQGRF